MLSVVLAVKLVLEIALLSLVGQWLLGLLAGAKRDSNMFYQLLAILTRPFTRLTRWIAPKMVIDRHIPLATFVLLSMVWVIATLSKVSLCMQMGVQLCQ